MIITMIILVLIKSINIINEKFRTTIINFIVYAWNETN